MYLREMGSLRLLSREGEIAIAKRIEGGRGVMIGGICESPLTVGALMLWRDSLQEGKILLRDIIDLDGTYGSTISDRAGGDAAVVLAAVEVGDGDEAEIGEDVGSQSDNRDACSISLATMEAELRPSVVAIFDQIADIHRKLNKL